MIGVLAAMAQKGERLPPELKSYGADPASAAFYFAESIKARALLEAIAAKAGTGSSHALPSDLAAREKNLQVQMAKLEARREEIFQPHVGMGRDVTAFQAELKDLQDKQQALVEELRRRFGPQVILAEIVARLGEPLQREKEALTREAAPLEAEERSLVAALNDLARLAQEQATLAAREKARVFSKNLLKK